MASSMVEALNFADHLASGTLQSCPISLDRVPTTLRGDPVVPALKGGRSRLDSHIISVFNK